MKNIIVKHRQAARRANRTRKKIAGVSSRPRLSVSRSSRFISAQIIDDTQGKTLASASDNKMTGKPMERAALVGAELAKKALDAKVTEVVFDRGSFKYHGRIKALADAAREAGLVF